MQYHPSEIESKWQKFWAENQTFKAENKSDKPKYYVLDMFPYPSGVGLHVGHPLGYIASDIYARYKRHQGFNVLHPMGYDSFGLPAEQYAIQTGQHPALTTQENIERYREQLDKIGFSFDWSREVRTSNPDYYKWTQWIFIQLFNSYYCKKSNQARPIDELVEVFEMEGNVNIEAETSQETTFGFDEWNNFTEKEKSDILLNYRLTYLAEAEVNWCPALGTVLANDEVVNGVSERGGHPVERKKMTQWMMRITAYAERLLNGITYNEKALDWADALKESQKNWIGKSKGALVEFKVSNSDDTIKVFTTRPDTIFGVSYMTLAPEHPLVQEITTADKKDAVDAYIQKTAKRSERERMADVKSISGEFTGAYALHPFTGKQIPIWIGDYVLASYGTGAVMAVPAGDERDHAFASHFGLDIIDIFKDTDVSENAYTDKEGDVVLQNSDFLDGLTVKEALAKSIEALEEKKLGLGQVNYRLRDAVFSRQRYWGEPVPMYFKNGIPTPIPTECLPIQLPEVDEYLPTETGEPPLGRATDWAWSEFKQEVVKNEFIDHKTVFPLELNTMPGWAGSSWYLFRYMDANNENEFASKEALNYWENVDLYIGGSEHATGHLLYSRFWTKFLKDVGLIQVDEPFKKLINQGMILGESAFVYRNKETNEFVSYNLVDKAAVDNYQALHADIAFIDESKNTLDIEAFKNWRPEYKNAEFKTEANGEFYVSREVEKMSKSKFNVVNPDDICEEYGADTLRMYEMFLGPIEQYKPWNTNGLSGVFGFLKKLWKLYFDNDGFAVSEEEATKEEYKVLHTLIKKVTDDIEGFSFNTSISAFMIAVNDLQKLKSNKKAILEPLAILVSPFAPHIAEELWSRLGHTESISFAEFPKFEEKYLVEDSKAYPISFNGKMRFTMELPLDMSKEEIEKAVMADERTIKQLDGRTPKKVIVVPGKIVNLVG
ncbi:leucine--tRNA ligase [Weeksellaceae bacterium KMM 9713]|uniref:Leucine--tRNA ligase n=1 Tax=Profundicola chukchiensis TaxID=2961959 RepID=A0A9X4RTQ4_9FLAO|nr:leucine--tRNA ligase [Profundicola chukchiensis]MDG4945283.1 leucine--tRNA ligase [Profundicola chukchiensis]